MSLFSLSSVAFPTKPFSFFRRPDSNFQRLRLRKNLRISPPSNFPCDSSNASYDQMSNTTDSTIVPPLLMTHTERTDKEHKGKQWMTKTSFSMENCARKVNFTFKQTLETFFKRRHTHIKNFNSWLRFDKPLPPLPTEAECTTTATSVMNTEAEVAAITEEVFSSDLSDYMLDETIGVGTFSVVKRGYKAHTNTSLAIKSISKTSCATDDVEMQETMGVDADSLKFYVSREVKIWRRCQHTNILPLLHAFETPMEYCIVMPYCPSGTLIDLMKRHGTPTGILPMELTRHVFLGLGKALVYLSEDCGIIHGDVKLENVLLDRDLPGEQGEGVILADFGLAVELETPLEKRIDCGGSVEYCSPQRLKGPDYALQPSDDAWSVGVVGYALLHGQLPYEDAFPPRLVKKILENDEVKCAEKSEVCVCVERWLKKDVSERWTVRKGIELLEERTI